MGDYAKKIADLKSGNDKYLESYRQSKKLFKDTYEIDEPDDLEYVYDRTDDNEENDFNETRLNENTSYSNAELAEVKTYYSQYIANTGHQENERVRLYVCICAIIAVITLSYITLSIGSSYESKPIIYKADHVVDTIKQPVIVKNKEAISSTPTVVIPNKVEPTVVNNYNFEKLNTGLINLSYCLLICFATFFSIKGFSLLGKSLKIKSQIKKSKNLIKAFNNAVNSGNYIAISQEINEQLLMNNIVIERFNNNSNTIELMAITERLKDIGTVINKNILTDLHNEK
jgi:hypothetical protein